MQAVVIDRYGPSSVLGLREVPRPALKSDQVLIEVHATSVNPIDWKIRDGLMSTRYGGFPLILGFDVSGVVADVGAAVTRFRPGEEVYARGDVGAGGCYAEFVAVGGQAVARKPAALTHEEAAALPLVGLTVLAGLRDCARLGAGQGALIVGGAGGVGAHAVQIARAMGAEVTAVTSTPNIPFVTQLGAQRVRDYTRGPVLANDDRYELIYDTIGTLGLDAARPALAAGGVYLTLVPTPGIEMFFPGKTERKPGERCGYFVAWSPKGTDLDVLTDWVQSGQLRPVIDGVYPLAEIRAAHERSQTLRARGKIVVRVR